MPRTKRALLTDRDRKFLPNQDDYYQGENAKQQRYEARSEICDRLTETLKDFTLLFDHLGERERQKVFGETQGQIDDPDLEEGARDALAFILRELDVIKNINIGNNSETAAERLLIDALQRVADEQTTEFVVDGLEFNPETIQVNLENAREKARNGEQLTPAETYILVERGSAELKLTD